MKMNIQMKTNYIGNQKTIILNKNNLSNPNIKIKNLIHLALKVQ
jgi:hypothetical protein